MKACFKCGMIQPLDQFYKHPRMADGHLNKCKTCTKTDVHERRHGAGRDTVLAYDRLRASQPHRRENAKRVIGRWAKEHPKRKLAQAKLSYAVNTGRIIPWATCSIPGCDHKPEAHHPDYSRPLDVVWLCSAHHKQAHALARTEDTHV